MAQEMRSGVFTAIFAKYAAKSRATGAAALTQIALAVERQAKVNLAKSTHRYGTPTPARPGGPPALVSGTGRRSITHTRPTPAAGGVEVRVGVASGFYPPYPKKGKRTPSSRYLYYLETGNTRNGAAYPFLVPAFQQATAESEILRLIAAEWRTP